MRRHLLWPSLLVLTGCYGFVVDHRNFSAPDSPTATLSISADHRLDELRISHCEENTGPNVADPLVLVARKSDDRRRDPAWEVTVDANTCYEVVARSWRHNLYKRITLAPDEVEVIKID